MTQSHSERPADLPRPRLWVPGLAYVTEAGDVHLGKNAGYRSDGPAFRRLRIGCSGRLAHWTHVAWLAPRHDLDHRVIAAHGIILPETLVDRDDQPHAHRWLREQSLVCISGVSWRRVADAGVRVYRVAFDATGDRVLDVEGAGGPAAPASLTVPLATLENAMMAAWNGSALVDVQGHPSPIDRALRVISDGALDEASVMNAFDARCLIEDGYGYRGALEGQFADMNRVAPALCPLDRIFGQIYERAVTMRQPAERLLVALARAGADRGEMSVPVYGTARRVIVPPLHIPGVPRLVLRGERREDLVLPSERRWSVDRVDPWAPDLPAEPENRSRPVSVA